LESARFESGHLARRRQIEGHFGLSGMRERAAIVKGRLEVRSGIRGGTEIELRVPAAIAYRASGRTAWWSRSIVSGESGCEQ
jgi:signal transduction histidine kinase